MLLFLCDLNTFELQWYYLSIQNKILPNKYFYEITQVLSFVQITNEAI